MSVRAPLVAWGSWRRGDVAQVVVIDEEPADDGTVSAGAAFLARILQYQETPQYLRK